MDSSLDELIGGYDAARGSRRRQSERSKPYSATAPTSLIAHVKEWQRADIANTEAWRAYCDHHGDGSYDPTRYDGDFLADAIAKLCRGGQGWIAGGGGGFGDGTLTETLKEWQRSDARNTEAWRKYCEAYGDGSYDPARYDSSFLKSALTELRVGSGGQPRWTCGNSTHGFLVSDVEEVKEWQRAAKANTEAWRKYCDKYGDSMYDPASHSASFLKQALAHLAGLPEGDERQPRSRVNSWVCLVDEIKEWQRSAKTNTVAWRSYCDEHGDGRYDPTVYEATFLKQALDELCGGVAWNRVGSRDLAEEVKEWQRSDRAHTEAWRMYCDTYGDSKYDPASHNLSFLKAALLALQGPNCGASAASASCHRSLVEEIKQWQRVDMANTKAWRRYCDAHLSGRYDPFCHDSGVLRAALERLCSQSWHISL